MVQFVTQNGDSSKIISDQLTEREKELELIDGRLLSLRSANVDKLLVTPFVLKDKFQKLHKLFENDVVMANATLRKIVLDGLRCSPKKLTIKKNHNQNNSQWIIEGEILISLDSALSESYVTPIVKQI